MIVKTLQDVKNENMIRKMPSGTCESRRYLLRKDGMGFSLHQTVLYKGQHMYINYVNHLEAVFITHGHGWIEVVDSQHDLGKGVRHELSPGTMYALDGHEKHWLGAHEHEDVTCICVFVPPCDGTEVQNAQGSFPFVGADGKPDYDYWKNKETKGEKISVDIEAGYSKK